MPVWKCLIPTPLQLLLGAGHALPAAATATRLLSLEAVLDTPWNATLSALLQSSATVHNGEPGGLHRREGWRDVHAR